MRMTELHPILPPLELLKHWEDQHFDESENYDVMLIQAYQAGADQELEACCEWLKGVGFASSNSVIHLQRHRRPRPPSLKEQALEAARIELIEGGKNADLIIRALQKLPDDA